LAYEIWRVELHHCDKFHQNRSIHSGDMFDFSRCLPPPSWILEILKFYWLASSGEPCKMQYHAKFCQNLIVGFWEITLFIFQDGIRRQFRFQKFSKFIVWGEEGWDASLCPILSKSVNPLQSYYDFSIFQGGRRRNHLWQISWDRLRRSNLSGSNFGGFHW